jgi:small subunit ribosomal protein S17
MMKSATVAVERSFKDQKYGKIMTRTQKLVIHDENNDCGTGDLVKVMETRPLSKRKRWRLVEIIEKAK